MEASHLAHESGRDDVDGDDLRVGVLDRRAGWPALVHHHLAVMVTSRFVCTHAVGEQGEKFNSGVIVKFCKGVSVIGREGHDLVGPRRSDCRGPSGNDG